jgi:hypothetical protein
MYACSLLEGINCNNLEIRTTTVKGYLEAAQKLMAAGGYKHEEGLPLDVNHNQCVEKFLARAKKWEGLPKRREMLSDEMLDIFWERKQAAKEDSLDACFFDWLALSRYTGFRSSEWAQTRKTTFERIDQDNSAARAMVDSDFLFFDSAGRLLEKRPSNFNRVHRLNVCWRVQKNKQNGEVISYWVDTIDPRWCPVMAAWRICMRAQRHNLPDWMPLGTYYDREKKQGVLHERPRG